MTAEAIRLPRMYVTSALVFSITRALLLGYAYRDAALPLGDAVSMGGSWVFWFLIFASLFIFLSLVPKPKWAYCLNPITLTLLNWMCYSLGMFFSEDIRTNLRTVVLSSVINYFGGLIWILVITWIWHFVVCLRFFDKEPEED